MVSEKLLIPNYDKKMKKSSKQFFMFINDKRKVFVAAALILYFTYYLIFVIDNVSEILFKKERVIQKQIDTEDFRTLFDISDFKFIIQQPPCSDTDLLVLVHSKPSNYRQRQVIRQTWGSQELNKKYGKFQVYFLLGEVQHKIEQANIIKENDDYKDIIQGNFVDHYHNLTYKHVMALKWLKYFCNTTKLFLKSDDDVMYNMPYILESLKTSFWREVQDENEDVIICSYLPAGLLNRDPTLKWFISKETFERDDYPEYCMGYAVFYSPHVAIRLYEEVKFVPYIFIEDAYVLGYLRERVGVQVTDSSGVSNFNPMGLVNETKITLKNFFIGPYSIDIIRDGEAVWEGILRLNMKLKSYL